MSFPKKSISSRSKKLSVALEKNEYDLDFYKWTKKQTHLLKEGKIGDLDLQNLAEEIESLGKSDKRALQSHLINLILHLLKLSYQSEMAKNSNSWKSSLGNARLEIELLLRDSPSLKREIPKMLDFAYEKAYEKALEETNLPKKTFPKECPWTIEEVLKDG